MRIWWEQAINTALNWVLLLFCLSNRQWVLKTYNLWENELAFIETAIEADIRNNSAWNQVRCMCVV